MKANAPSEDSSLPPRHRLSLEKLRNETTESDLWNLDDERESAFAKSPTPPHPVTAIKIVDLETGHNDLETVHATRESEVNDLAITSEANPHQHGGLHPSESGESHRPRIDDIGELEGIDNWDDAEPPITAIQSAFDPQTAGSTALAQSPTHSSLSPDATALLIPSHTNENRRKSSTSRNEIISVASVAIGIIIFAGYFLVNALSGLPRIKDPYQKPDLPVVGNHFSVNKVNSYWRVPINTGINADTVQRDTALIPVLEITATGQDAALRIQFRNSDGAAVGDPITHAIRGDTSLLIPSTAGLEDINIHNAYRTNLIEPWTAEILEASATTTSGSEFRSLVTIPISPDRR